VNLPLERFNLGFDRRKVVVRREFVIECRSDFWKAKSVADSKSKHRRLKSGPRPHSRFTIILDACVTHQSEPFAKPKEVPVFKVARMLSFLLERQI